MKIFFFSEYFSWCRDCIDLKLEIICGDIQSLKYQKSTVENRLLDKCSEQYYPLLGWMSSLKSLIITRRGCYDNAKEQYDQKLLEWMFKRPINYLERLWVDGKADDFEHNFEFYTLHRQHFDLIASVKSYCVDEFCDDFVKSEDVNNERYHQLEHLASFEFLRLAQLPNLKYACGHCDDLPENNVITIVYTFLFLKALYYYFF